MRGARLFCTNGLLDDPLIDLVTGSFDLVIGNPPFSGRGLKDLLQLLQPTSGKASVRARSLFGDDAEELTAAHAQHGSELFTRHERQNLDHLVRTLSRYACWRLREESEDAVDRARNQASGGLFANLESDSSARASEYERMAEDIAACPADRLLDTRRPAVRNVIRRIAGTAIEVFFTERFVQLAKPGGMIAVIVPESILASDQLAPLRRWLMQEIQLLAVVGLPQKVFTGVGAKAKTGIVFARRCSEAEVKENRRAAALGRSQYLSPKASENQVTMVAPDTTSSEWSLSGYMSGVLERNTLSDG